MGAKLKKEEAVGIQDRDYLELHGRGIQPTTHWMII